MSKMLIEMPECWPQRRHTRLDSRVSMPRTPESGALGTPRSSVLSRVTSFRLASLRLASPYLSLPCLGSALTRARAPLSSFARSLALSAVWQLRTASRVSGSRRTVYLRSYTFAFALVWSALCRGNPEKSTKSEIEWNRARERKGMVPLSWWRRGWKEGEGVCDKSHRASGRARDKA